MSSFATPHHHGFSSATAVAANGVHGQKQTSSWRMLRTLFELLVPSCNCTFVETQDLRETSNQKHRRRSKLINLSSSSSFSSSSSIASAAAAVISETSTFTGTIFSCRRGKVNFCVQSTSKNTPNPMIIFLELDVPSEVLAREMREGDLRIALEPNYTYSGDHEDGLWPLLSTPLWDMYFNGRRVGFAMRREPSKPELSALKVLSTVAEGAGVVIGEEMNRDAGDHMVYLRASLKRIYGSHGSESFHLIDPRGNIGRGLSIFFLQSSQWICISPNDSRR